MGGSFYYIRANFPPTSGGRTFGLTLGGTAQPATTVLELPTSIRHAACGGVQQNDLSAMRHTSRVPIPVPSPAMNKYRVYMTTHPQGPVQPDYIDVEADEDGWRTTGDKPHDLIVFMKDGVDVFGCPLGVFRFWAKLPAAAESGSGQIHNLPTATSGS